MFSLRLVFLAMGISMTLSAAVLGGESPNDRISTILDVMTSISERVDKLVGKVGNMESKVNNMESKVDNIDHTEQLTAQKVSKIEDRMDQEGAEMKKRLDSVDTKMTSVSNQGTKLASVSSEVDKVDQDVKTNQIIQSNGWKYLGRGYMIGGIVEESYQGTYTLSQCCQRCETFC